LLVNVILRTRLTILQTVTVCLHVCSQFLKPVKNFISLIITDCAIRKGQTLIKKSFATIQCVSECQQFFRSYLENKSVTSKWNKCVRACVLQRSKPEVFQILNVGGQTLRLNLFDDHEFWLYGYNIQHVPQRDNWLWLFKKYLHREFSVCLQCKWITKSLKTYRNVPSAGIDTSGVLCLVTWPKYLRHSQLLQRMAARIQSCVL